jgi:organic radical activating enzyme
MNTLISDTILPVIGEGSLRTLIIEVTEQCNFKCGHCLRGPADKAVFDVSKLGIIFDNLPTLKYIDCLTLTGGEPLLHPEIIDQIIDTFFHYNVDVGSFYIATNGSAFNVESLTVIGRLYDFCCDNDISCVEVSNSKWHQSERDRLKVMGIPSCKEDMYDLYGEEMEEVANIARPSIYDVEFIRDHRTYVNIIKGGRSTTGKPADDTEYIDEEDTLLYLNSRGKFLLNFSDLSFVDQEKYAISI